MEFSSDLNTAHLLSRSSDRLLKKFKFADAVEQQDQVISSLTSALVGCKDEKIRQSIELQIQFHTKQKTLISIKKNKFKKDLRNLQIKMAATGLKDGDVNLQDSIYRAFQETESLLQHLRTREEVVEGTEVVEESDPSTGAKMPKDDKVIIEELQTANGHLRGMVEAMFGELETYKRENSELRAKISDLETELSLSRRGTHATPSYGAHVTPSYGDHASPSYGDHATPSYDAHATPSYPTLATPLSMTSTPTSIIKLQDSGHLPPLAPLELPTFDYNKKDF